MERRGYVKQGPSTPEAVIENPEAGRKKVDNKKIKVGLFFSKESGFGKCKYETRDSC